MSTHQPPPAATGPAPLLLRCHTVASSVFTHLNYVRDLSPLQLGERSGRPPTADVPTPSEMLLAALGSCLSTRIQANAVSAAIVVHRLEIHVEGELSASAKWDAPRHGERAAGFQLIRVAVELEAEASAQAIHTLVEQAVLSSPVANTLHDPIHLDVTVGDVA